MDELKVIEKNTVQEAEAEYLKLREEGCWQVVKAMKIVWSWKSMRHVARFTVKKVERRYDVGDFISGSIMAATEMVSILKSVASIYAANKRRLMEEKLNPIKK